MPYKTNQALPVSLTKHLPAPAQDIYREAFNQAHAEYKDASKRNSGASQEEVAHQMAWAAVKKKYEKGSDDKWHPKSA